MKQSSEDILDHILVKLLNNIPHSAQTKLFHHLDLYCSYDTKKKNESTVTSFSQENLIQQYRCKVKVSLRVMLPLDS